MADAAACVYVTQALLDTLERDKRSLKWQLARATKAADEHAAQSVACEAKVKDLMTIVEMNKSVAHKVVQRNYIKESVLQRLHQERMQLQTRVMVQQRRGVEMLERRITQRRHRTAFHAWAYETTLRCKRQLAIRRMLRSRRRRWLQEGITTWRWQLGPARETTSNMTAMVYPISSVHNYTYIAPEKMPSALQQHVRFVLSPSSSVRSDSTTSASTFGTSCKSLSFATWKSQWLARKRQHTTAFHFARLMLAKRVLVTWKHVVRRRNWREAMIASATHRWRYRCFEMWAAWNKRRRRARFLCSKMVKRIVRRKLRHAFVKLRIKCLEKRMTEWTDVLKDARQAMEEERTVHALHQNEAMRDIETKAAYQQSQLTLLMNAQLKAMQKKQRVAILMKFMCMWQHIMMLRNMQMRIADQHYHCRRQPRCVRRVFSVWKTTVRQHRALIRFETRRRACEAKVRLARSFTAFARTTKRLIAQKKCLRRILQKRSMLQSSRAFWKWYGAIALADEQANAHLQQRQLIERLEIHETTSHREAQRLRRVGYKYQLRCALALGDTQLELSKRRVFAAWKVSVIDFRNKKVALRKLLRRKTSMLLKLSTDRWWQVSDKYNTRQLVLKERARYRDNKSVKSVFRAWRAFYQKEMISSAHGALQFFTLLLWRKRTTQQRTRNAAFGVLLTLHVRYRWKKPAFQMWRRRVETVIALNNRQWQRRQELLRHTFQLWSVWFARRSRCRKLQFKTIAVRAEGRAIHRLLVAVLVAWRDQARQRKLVTRCINVSHSGRSKSERLLMLQKFWHAWVSATRNRKVRQVILRRVLDRRVMRATSDAWRRWKCVVDRENGIRTGQALLQRKIGRTTRSHFLQRELRRIFHDWRGITEEMKRRRLSSEKRFKQLHVKFLTRCFSSWRTHFVPLMLFRRILLRVIVTRLHKALLRDGIQTWKRKTQCVTESLRRQHFSTYQIKVQSQALVVLRRAWAIRDVRAHFVAWQSRWRQCKSLKRVIERILTKKATQLARLTWSRWKHSVAAYALARRAADVWSRRVLRLAWCQLRATAQTVRDQQTAALLLRGVFTKAMARCTWNQWRRRDHALLVFRITSANSASSSLLHAFMNRVGLRHFTKSLLASVFEKWRAHVRQQRSLRRRIVVLLTKQDSHCVKWCFSAWALDLATKRNARRRLSRILLRRCFVMQRVAFIRWCAFAKETVFSAKLMSAQRQLKTHREALARRVAMALFLSWQKPTVTAVLRGWRGVVDAHKGAIKGFLVRRSDRRTKVVWSVWRNAVRHRQIAQSALVALLHRKENCMIAVAWRAWIERVWWMDSMSAAFHRLSTSLRLRLLRCGWRSLRLHQDTVMRQQSMMVAISAQQQLNQQKKLHRLRNMAFLLQRQHTGRIKHRFMLWKEFVWSRRKLKSMLLAVTKRYGRRATHVVLRAWRGIVIRKRTRERRITKWQNTKCRIRLLRVVWRLWNHCATSGYQARLGMQRFLEWRVKQLLLAAWNTWQRAVEVQIEAEKAAEIAHWRRATTVQLNQVTSLESKAERLLLKSVELERTMQTLRLHCAEAFVKRTERVLDAALTRMIKMRWARWLSLLDRLNAAQWLVHKLAALNKKPAFVRWKQETQLCKFNHHEVRVLEKVARIMAESAVLVQKKKLWWQWLAYAKQRRAKRIQNRVIDLLRRKKWGDITQRSVFISWKTAARNRKHRLSVALRIAKTVDQHLLRLVLGAWTMWRECERSKREATHMLSRIGRAIERRSVEHHWRKWRNYMTDAAGVLAKSCVVLMEIGTSEREVIHNDQTVLLRVLTAWRVTANQQRLRRADRRTQQDQFDSLWTKRQAMHGWRKLVHAIKLKDARNQQPVLCIRTNITKRCKRVNETSTCVMGGAVLSFADYTQHRRRVHWRVQLARCVTQTRLRRFYGLAWLLHSLRRQHRRIQRRALWQWFAAIQPISCALQAVHFAALPWRRADVDYAGSMLLLTLEELDLVRQTHRTEQIQRAWCIVNVVARSIQRQATRRAFDKWCWSRHKRVGSACRSTGTHRVVERSTTNTERARARACIAQLMRAQMRRAFGKWKSQYVASAIAQAQADHDTLQAALARTVMERRVKEAHM